MAPDQEVTRDRKDQARLIGFLVVLAVLIALIADNLHEVRVDYVVGDSRIRMVWLLLVTALLGALADRLIRWRRRQ